MYTTGRAISYPQGNPPPPIQQLKRKVVVLFTGVVAEIKIPFNSMSSMSKWLWCSKNLLICLAVIFEFQEYVENE